MRITAAGNVGIGSNTNITNILHGNGGKLRISNGTDDYTLKIQMTQTKQE
jgi:hypothetical protein